MVRIPTGLSGLSRRVAATWLVFFLFNCPPVSAGEVLLDDQDISDWVLAGSEFHWKQKGSALGPRSLLAFDLSDLGNVVQVNQATLHLFIERGQPGATLEVYHVHDDSWGYELGQSSDGIYNWPVMELIASISAGDTAAVNLDVTSQVAEDAAPAGNGILSIKLQSTPNHTGIRVASPLASRWLEAPRLHVDFVADPTSLDLPDLTLSTSDITFAPMQPVVGGTVMVSARVRNNSSAASFATTVEFWDGPPGAAGSSSIGSASLPGLAPGGGAALVQTTWTQVPRGVHDVHVRVDPANLVLESDESNNIDFRPFLIADEYEQFFESFEYAGRNEYYTDFDFPREFGTGLEVPKPAFLERSGAASCHGDYHMEAILDGNADDGTVWIERALPAEPWSRYRVRAEWRDFRYEPDELGFFPAVAAVGVLDPEMESDFTVVGSSVEAGCNTWSYEQVVETGHHDHVWVAFGFTVVWESPAILGLDSVFVELEKLASTDVESTRDRARLWGPNPNPSSSGTDFEITLPERVRLKAGIYDVKGRLVRRFFDGYDGPGPRRFHWDGRTATGAPAPQGVYFFSLKANGEPLAERKVLLIR